MLWAGCIDSRLVERFGAQAAPDDPKSSVCANVFLQLRSQHATMLDGCEKQVLERCHAEHDEGMHVYTMNVASKSCVL